MTMAIDDEDRWSLHEVKVYPCKIGHRWAWIQDDRVGISISYLVNKSLYSIRGHSVLREKILSQDGE